MVGNFTKKCTQGGLYRFERAVLLTRNPFDSIWSEYQRRVTVNHTGQIRKVDYSEKSFINDALELANQYVYTHSMHYKSLRKKFREEDILYLRFENFMNRGSSSSSSSQDRHLSELKKLVKFLNVSRERDDESARGSDGINLNTNSRAKVSEDKLGCAFTLAESPKVSILLTMS
jgi:hypothetical protein